MSAIYGITPDPDHMAALSPPAMLPYGCHNKPRPIAGGITHVAQNGWTESRLDFRGNIRRSPVYIDIKHTMSTECRYDAAAKDPGCAGCQHINQGAV